MSDDFSPLTDSGVFLRKAAQIHSFKSVFFPKPSQRIKLKTNYCYCNTTDNCTTPIYKSV